MTRLRLVPHVIDPRVTIPHDHDLGPERPCPACEAAKELSKGDANDQQDPPDRPAHAGPVR